MVDVCASHLPQIVDMAIRILTTTNHMILVNKNDRAVELRCASVRGLDNYILNVNAKFNLLLHKLVSAYVFQFVCFVVALCEY